MANPEHLELLMRGVAFWNKNKPESVDLESVDLSDTDFSSVDLSGAWLHRASLFGMDLSYANLSFAFLEEAHLIYSKFNGANLFGARLRKANLEETQLCKADLREADLSYASLIKANLSEADLGEGFLYCAVLSSVNFYKSNLRNATLSYSKLNYTNLSEADLSKAELVGAMLNWADFKHANLGNANLSEADLSGAFCQNANFTNVNLSFVRLSNTNLNGANLTGVRLWETQRAGWSIKDVICEYAYFEENDMPTYFSPGEFERLYSDKTKVVLSFQGGILPLEIATLPALIKHLENSYPGCSLRLVSINDAAGGVSVVLVVDNDSDFSPEETKQIKAQLTEKGNELIEYQKKALKEKEKRLLLEGKVEVLNSFVDKLIMRPTQQIKGDIHHMGDNYTAGQGIVGKNVHDIHDINFNQIGGQIEKSMDLAELATQLKQLREAMSQEAKEPEHYIAIGKVAEAEEAAKAKEPSKVAESLKAAGKWALDFATKIGVSLATDALKKSMGM